MIGSYSSNVSAHPQFNAQSKLSAKRGICLTNGIEVAPVRASTSLERDLVPEVGLAMQPM